MKKKISTLLTAFSAACLCAQQFGNFEIEDGELCLGTHPVKFTYFDTNWGIKSFGDSASHAEGCPKAEKGKSYADEAAIIINGGKNAGTLLQKFSFTAENSCRFEASFRPSSTEKFNEVSYSFSFPIQTSELSINGAVIDLENSKNIQSDFRANRISVATPQGLAKFSGDLKVLLQDGRLYGSESFSLRFRPENSGGALNWNMGISFEKVKGAAVPLSEASDLGIPALPSGWIKLGGIDFNFSRPAGKGLVAEAGKEKKLALKGGGRHLYIIGAFDAGSPLEGDCAELEVAFADGKTQTVKISAENSGPMRHSKSSDNPNVIWTSKAGGKTYTLFATKADLDRPNPVSATIKNLSNSDWKIAAASVCPVPVPVERLKGAFVTQSRDYAPFEPSKTIAKGSAIDFSWLLDAPAGKYGFAYAKGGEIFFEKSPGKPARFYGNNLCFQANYPDRENAEKLADLFAATGYNILRIHHYDDPLIDKSSPDLLSFDAEKLDRLDYLVAAMKKRGIYITTDLFVSRKLAKDAVEPGLGWDGKMNSNKAAFFVSKKASENFRAFSKKLLEHVNPYTGIAWKDEPALISLSLVNENTIFGTYSAMRPHFEKLFEEWLAKNSLKADDGNTDMLRRRFLAELYGKFFDEQKGFLRSLGVRAMLTDQNFWTGYPVTLMRKSYDIVDTHAYFGHPSFIEKPWQLPAKMKTESAISKYGGCIELSESQIAGKPFSITEWNYVNNNDHAAEGAFLMGAYGALHKWDVLCRFAYSHGEIDFSKPAGVVSFFDTSTNPVSALSERAGALFFLRGDVRASDFSIPVLLPEDYPSRKNREDYASLLKRAGLYAATEIELNPTPAGFKIPADAPFAIAAEKAVIERNKFDKPAILDSVSALPELQKLTSGKIDVKNEVYESETSEMVLDKKRQTWKLVTARSEAFISPKGESFKGDFANIRNSRGWSSTLIASIDKKPLKESTRILILHLSDVKNTNMRFDDPEMTILRASGTTPHLARRAESVVTFNDAREGWKLYALRQDGSRGGEVEIERANAKASAKLSTVRGKSVVFAYELVKE